MSAECKRLSAGEHVGPNCGCGGEACALQLPSRQEGRMTRDEAHIARLTQERDDARAMTRIANSRAAEERAALKDAYASMNAEQRRAYLARAEAAERALARAVFLAEHLWQMVPQSAWRDHGGDDGQGHYEGDYHAEKVREELRALADAAHPQIGVRWKGDYPHLIGGTPDEDGAA